MNKTPENKERERETVDSQEQRSALHPPWKCRYVGDEGLPAMKTDGIRNRQGCVCMGRAGIVARVSRWVDSYIDIVGN